MTPLERAAQVRLTCDYCQGFGIDGSSRPSPCPRCRDPQDVSRATGRRSPDKRERAEIAWAIENALTIARATCVAAESEAAEWAARTKAKKAKKVRSKK